MTLMPDRDFDAEAPVSDVLRFYRDAATDAPRFETPDDSYSALGSLLTGDIAGSTFGLLEFLEGVELVNTGSAELEEWNGNGWSGAIRSVGVHLQDLHSDDWSGDYSLAFARQIALDYLDFLVVDPRARDEALHRWESRKGRRHPMRDEILRQD
jgi:hypothetical protein